MITMPAPTKESRRDVRESFPGSLLRFPCLNPARQKKRNHMKTAMIAFSIVLATAISACAQQQPGNQATTKKWWVSGIAGITEYRFRGGKLFTIGIYVAAKPASFAAQLTRDSWETNNKTRMAPDPILEMALAATRNDRRFSVPNQELSDGTTAKLISFMCSGKDVESMLRQHYAIRLKGELTWWRFEDFIKVEPDREHFHLSQCLACSATIAKGTKKCPRCGTLFGP